MCPACDAEPVSTLDLPISRLDGEPTTLRALAGGRAALVVNVASRCGLTPQYEVLETLHKQYFDKGLTVIGFPCNQFDHQEPGTSGEIAAFCSMTYGVTFPMTEKVNVNNPGRHVIYAELVKHPYEDGDVGDVEWNFEKYLLSSDGRVVRRFRPDTEPDDPMIIEAIESLLS